MKTISLMSLFLFALTFTSCEETKRVIDVAGNVQISGTYVVKSMAGAKAASTNQSITFAALDGSANGNAGCNTFFGNYTLDLYALSFGDFAVTEKVCDAPIMASERAFLEALKQTGSYSLENDLLTLYSKTNRSVLLTATKN